MACDFTTFFINYFLINIWIIIICDAFINSNIFKFGSGLFFLPYFLFDYNFFAGMTGRSCNHIFLIIIGNQIAF